MDWNELARDIIEGCKLAKAIEVRKELGYNHDDIMVWEETSIAEKIIKLFPNENIVLNKKFNYRKPDILFKGAEASSVKIATEVKNCFRLKEMSNLNILWNFQHI